MVLKDNGMANNPPKDDEVTPNRELELPTNGEDSDSDLDENDQWGGYMPLAQNPNDAEALYNTSPDSEDDEINLQEAEAADTSNINPETKELKPESVALVEEVWSKPTPKEVDIEMSDKKIDLVKEVMLNIKLPSEAIPPWAQNIPEDEWKQHLLQRLNKTG